MEPKEKREYSLGQGVSILVLFVFLAIGAIYFGLKSANKAAEATPTPGASAEVNFNMTTPSPVQTVVPAQSIDVEKLTVEDLVLGNGQEAVSGKKVTVNYSGTLLDGRKFDSSYDRGTPFSFTLGAGSVIRGWDEGLVGMKIGGKRKLTIPSSMGYSNVGVAGVIPPNAALVFEIELLGVE